STSPALEIIVVDDASTDDTSTVAAGHGVVVLRLARNSGPGAARNAGGRAARGDIVFFVDADVVAAPDAIARVVQAFEADLDLVAIFGSYDRCPRAPGLVSQYRFRFLRRARGLMFAARAFSSTCCIASAASR